MSNASSQAKHRTCGSCTLCCTYLEIESQIGYSTLLDSGDDVAKPAGVACRFLTKNGCSVYKTRPIVCRKFACDWLRGKKGFHRDEPPHKTGVIGVRGNTVALSVT